jgi:hypothetical protein
MRQYTSDTRPLRVLSVRQHTSAYVRIRQHASEYVSIRQTHALCASCLCEIYLLALLYDLTGSGTSI